MIIPLCNVALTKALRKQNCGLGIADTRSLVFYKTPVFFATKRSCVPFCVCSNMYRDECFELLCARHQRPSTASAVEGR